MLAKKCDSCGVLYETYGTKQDHKNASGIMLLNIDEDGAFYKSNRIDLCPVCMQKVYVAIGMKKEK